MNGSLRCIISHNKFGDYCVPESSSHRPAAQKIIAGHVHEPETVGFLISHCGDGDIVHAGTYFGDFLPALSNRCAPSAKVWAFEPNPENFRCASLTIKINNLGNVALMNAGLGAKSETLLIKTCDENGLALGGTSAILRDTPDELDGTKSVPMVTVDDVVDDDRNISIVQLDVEGYEKEALSGAINTIRRCLPIIIVEVLAGSTLISSDWYHKNILSLGYRMTKRVHGNSVFVCQGRSKV